jgi:hypothetical protein
MSRSENARSSSLLRILSRWKKEASPNQPSKPDGVELQEGLESMETVRRLYEERTLGRRRSGVLGFGQQWKKKALGNTTTQQTRHSMMLLDLERTGDTLAPIHEVGLAVGRHQEACPSPSLHYLTGVSSP